MKLRNKKGFTIIELVIVIAVIGILTAVLVPTFISLMSRANKASDQSLIKNLNTAMQAEEADGKKNDTYHDAIEYLDNYGFKLANLATKSGYDLLWNSKSNRFLLNNPDDLTSDKIKTGAEDVQYWTIKDNIPNNNKFSIYAGLNFSEEVAVNVTGVGFDAGEHNFENIYYTGNSNTNKVVLRTNGGSLNVTAPLDTINHYGKAKVVTLTSVSSNSYYEHGVSNLVDIKNGRLVITNTKNAEVGTIYLTATENAYDGIVIATQQGSELPDVVAREQVDLPTGDSKKLVVTIQSNVNENGQNPTKTESIYLYPAKDVKEQSAGYDVSDLGLLVVEAISSEAINEATTQLEDKGQAVINKVKEEKVQEIEGISTGALYYAGGNGSVKSPYLISNAEELSNVRQVLDGNFKVINDIDMSGVTEWTPIGNSANPFRGKLDGDNYAITNWTATNPTLFGRIRGTSNSNLNGSVDDILDGSNQLIDNNLSEDNYDCVLKNLNVTNSNIVIDDLDYGIFAWIVVDAYVENCEVSNSQIRVVSGWRTGVLFGRVAASHIKDLHLASNNSIIFADTPAPYLGNFGLLIGAIWNDASSNDARTVIDNCVNDANVVINSSTYDTGFFGGIVGIIGSGIKNSVFSNCVNNGNIILNNQKNNVSVSGILGAHGGGKETYFVNCSNTGNITTTGYNCLPGTNAGYGQISGIASYVAGPFINCVNTGTLSGNFEYIGGICAACSSNGAPGLFANCSNTGNIIKGTGTLYTGDVCGLIPSNVTQIVSVNDLGSLASSVYKIKLTNTSTAGGTLVVPASVGYIEVDESTFGFDSIDLSSISGTLQIKVSNATISLLGNNSNASISIVGENNNVAIGSSVVLNNVKIDGSGSTIINNGTINHLAIVNTNTTNTNNGTMGSVQFIGSDDLEMTFVNNGSIGENGDNWHTVQTQSQINLTFTNNGTIYGTGEKYALLFYGMSNVTFNAGAESSLVIENATYTGVFYNVDTMRADTVTFNVASGAAGVSGDSYYGIATHLSGGATQVTVNIEA